jgi:hypothetical protein
MVRCESPVFNICLASLRYRFLQIQKTIGKRLLPQRHVTYSLSVIAQGDNRFRDAGTRKRRRNVSGSTRIWHRALYQSATGDQLHQLRNIGVTRGRSCGQIVQCGKCAASGRDQDGYR